MAMRGIGWPQTRQKGTGGGTLACEMAFDFAFVIGE